ncbi:hypothetical protein [Flammeovirga sp. SJP92]|uniref:hypothetical protein n=1 Tax=Flammeovirga sp. SJP92 TaxID=1775430 RepID=UPI0012FB6332|nr:hypothetical protein [Flammeovirga sp. SJP92]
MKNLLITIVVVLSFFSCSEKRENVSPKPNPQQSNIRLNTVDELSQIRVNIQLIKYEDNGSTNYVWRGNTQENMSIPRQDPGRYVLQADNGNPEQGAWRYIGKKSFELLPDSIAHIGLEVLANTAIGRFVDKSDFICEIDVKLVYEGNAGRFRHYMSGYGNDGLVTDVSRIRDTGPDDMLDFITIYNMASHRHAVLKGKLIGMEVRYRTIGSRPSGAIKKITLPTPVDTDFDHLYTFNIDLKKLYEGSANERNVNCNITTRRLTPVDIEVNNI